MSAADADDDRPDNRNQDRQSGTRLGIPKEGWAGVLTHLRAECGWSREELARATGISTAMLAKVEKAARGLSRENLYALARVYWFTADELQEFARDYAEAGDNAEWIAHIKERLTARLHESGLVGSPAPMPTQPAPMYSTPLPAAPPMLSEPMYASAPPPERGPVGGARQVAALPTGQVWYLHADVLGRESDGTVWIAPLAEASTIGDPDKDPRIERYEDGTLIVDLRDRTAHSLAPRNPDRHLTLVELRQGEPPEPARVVDVYLQTVIHIDWDGTPITLRALPEGEEPRGEFPDGVEIVHLLTAHNPRSRLLLPNENREREELLRSRLGHLGWTHHPAEGRSPHGSWSEASHAIVDATREEVLALAEEYDQNAIYEWTPDALTLVWTVGGRVDRRSWERIDE